jgi:type IV pilus assembly protein PilE
MHRKKMTKGFTLIEIMIVVAIIGVLSAILYPSYNELVYKSGRADAKVELSDIAQRIQRCFTTTNTYDPLEGACGVIDELSAEAGITSMDGKYQITLTNHAATTFTLVAKPATGSRQANDTKCTEFRLTQSGVRTALKGEADNTSECW